ncbi:hypothetical protein [Clostridium sp. MD294]|uniref:hypothetical protein n=1 Tax=Clostridium sp. MD294 TaxID=97138 RepID=UPI0002CC0660|nr:hypothetical protein [Clostridium sp. MD294]NDO45414.1 hypothetical protein [Clostridium sp. MD294]USF30941.1 hypothetical protein C820_002385 [Clostridium sp. MD294]
MAEATDTYGILYQNLIDANCDDIMIEKCMKFAQEGKKAEMLSLLLQHRTSLLNMLHKRHNNIDCIDYLIYKIKKEQEQ